MPTRPPVISTSRLLAVFGLVVLALLTTAWTTFDRGLFQDDAQTLFRIYLVDGVWSQLWHPIGTPSRRLQGVPYALALQVSNPLAWIQVWSEALPWAIAVVVMAIARLGARLPRPWAFVAGALTVTATSDWLTASPVAIGYHLAILLHALGVLGLTAFVTGRGAMWLAAGVVTGTASLWTVDAATTLYPFMPVLVWLMATDEAGRRRAHTAAVLWWLAAVPYYVTFIAFLGDSSSYASVAILDTPWWHRTARLVLLVLQNVTPWRWASARPDWFGHLETAWWPAAILPMVAGLASVSTVATWLRGQGRDERVASGRSPVWLALAFAASAVVVNATYMAVHLAHMYYRTQLHSRLWASLALATGLYALSRRGPREARVAVGVVALFIAGGIAGGQERQAYFNAHWQRHRVELASVAEAFPADRGAHLLLYRPEPPALYRATEAPYLARAWATLLGEDQRAECRLFLVDATRGTSCTAEADGLVCRGDHSARCAAYETPGHRIPYDRLVVAAWNELAGRYDVQASLPAPLLPTGEAGAVARRAYQPARLAPGRVETTLARQLLALPEGRSVSAEPR